MNVQSVGVSFEKQRLTFVEMLVETIARAVEHLQFAMSIRIRRRHHHGFPLILLLLPILNPWRLYHDSYDAMLVNDPKHHEYASMRPTSPSTVNRCPPRRRRR